MACFSFHPVKAITTGEGGAVTTNDDELAERLRGLPPPRPRARARRGPLGHPTSTRSGFNYRLTDIQAALGASQLHRLDRFITRREELAARYDAALADLDVVPPPRAPAGSVHARHLYPVLVEHRAEVVAELHRRDIGVQVHHVPIYRHPAYAAGTVPADMPETEALYAHLLSLPLFYDLTVDEQDIVIDALTDVVG